MPIPVPNLPPEFAAAVQAIGPSAFPALLEIACGEPRQGTAREPVAARILAVELLVRLYPDQAVEPLLGLLVGIDPTNRPDAEDASQLLEPLHNALASLGKLALEPALLAYPRTPDEVARHRLSSLLSDLGVHDNRITAILLAELEHDPAFGACLLESYADVSVIDHLVRALDAAEVSRAEFPDDGIEGLADAIVTLGGTLTSAQQTKLARAVRFRQEYVKRRRRLDDEYELA